jgi:hypothetical protein
MKAWSDITRTPWKTNNSEYYIDMGVKIERLHDGAFRIYNVMGNNFTLVNDYQYSIFETKGFQAGACRVMMDQLADEVSKANFDRRKKIIEQYLELKKKYINFVQI